MNAPFVYLCHGRLAVVAHRHIACGMPCILRNSTPKVLAHANRSQDEGYGYDNPSFRTRIRLTGHFLVRVAFTGAQGVRLGGLVDGV